MIRFHISHPAAILADVFLVVAPTLFFVGRIVANMKQSDLEKLSHAEFWDTRYATEKGEAQRDEDEDGTEGELGNFEWFRTFEDLKQFFEKRLPASEKNPEILHLGCGNSVSGSFEKTK